MKSKIHLFILLLSTILFLGCKSETKKKPTNLNADQKDIIVEKKSNIIDSDTKEYEPSGDEIREYGKIETIEDGGYPMFSITVDFVERQMKQSFGLNIEAISLTDSDLNKLKGKYATIYYTSDLENDISDLYYNGKSLSGEYAPEMDSSWKKITGTLSGATSLSGDLPGKITVTDSEGEKITFEWFIDDEVLKVNGKTITAFYTVRGVNKITHIEPSEE